MERHPARTRCSVFHQQNLLAFTLLEMLVALVIVSVLTLALYSSLSIGFRAEKSARAAIEPVQTAGALIAIIQRDLESALPPTGLLAGDFIGENEVGNNGLDSDLLSFYTTSGNSDIEYPEKLEENLLQQSMLANSSASAPLAPVQQNVIQRARSDIQFVEYYLEQDDYSEDMNLVRSVTKNLLAQITPEPQKQVVCRNVLSFNVQYLDGTEWLESWDSTQQDDAIPPAVEVSLEIRSVEQKNPWARSRDRYQTFIREEEQTRQIVQVIGLPCSAPPAEDEAQIIR